MKNGNLTRFFDILNNAVSDKSLVKLVLSSVRDHSSDLKSIVMNIVDLKQGSRLNFVYRYKTKDITKNYGPEEAMALVSKALEDDFFNADLFSVAATYRLFITLNGKIKIRTSHPELKPATSFSHNRLKERLIPAGNNIYLRELGILNQHFEVRHEMNDKYMQINRYIELLAPFFWELDLPPGFHVADMGSGKGYLTFSLYDYLTNTLGKSPVMTGVESRSDLVALSNRIAEKAGFTNLKFIAGTIRDAVFEKTDILIALHACDTATDDAIFRGITGGASLIVCAPCCHKQIRKEFRVNHELKSVLKHGILEERQAEIITDGIRALVLAANGYRTKVFEFISTEHTPKNVMIVGRKVKGSPAGKEKAMESIRAVKELFGIREHYLEGLISQGAL